VRLRTTTGPAGGEGSDPVSVGAAPGRGVPAGE
jgi:hypothetical protein